MGSRHDRRRSRSRERYRSRSPAHSPQKHRRHASRSPSPRAGSRHSPRRDHSYEGRDRHRDGRHADRPSYREDRNNDAHDDRSYGRDGHASARSKHGHDHQQLPGPPPRGPGGPQRGSPPRGRGAPNGSPGRQKQRWGKEGEDAGERKKEPTPPPDFGYSGKLVEETNKVNGVVCKYTEPPESRKPSRRWRLYIWKNNQLLNDPLQIHRQNWFMFGRERRLVDVPTDHPSCSKQHAVLQYRLVEVPDEYGVNQQIVKPYLMDLGSVNGTFINGDRLEGNRYYELLEKDVIKFGSSSREYILLAEDTNT